MMKCCQHSTLTLVLAFPTQYNTIIPIPLFKMLHFNKSQKFIALLEFVMLGPMPDNEQ